MSLNREDVAPLAAELVSAADKLRKEAEMLRQLDHHPAWIGSNVDEIIKGLRLSSARMKSLQGFKKDPVPWKKKA